MLRMASDDGVMKDVVLELVAEAFNFFAKVAAAWTALF